MAGGIVLWAASTLLMGFAGGFASLLVLRVMLGVGESIAFPGSSKIIARTSRRSGGASPMRRSPPGIALGPAVGTLAGGLILGAWGWRAMFFVFGLATLSGCCRGSRPCGRLPTTGHHDDGREVPVGVAARQMAAVVDVDRPLRSAITASISCSPGCRCS